MMQQPTQQQREAALAEMVRRHGRRVRRQTAMKLLDHDSASTFRKVVDANPQLVHKLKGERQPRYLTSEIFELLPLSAWCATGGVDGRKS